MNFGFRRIFALLGIGIAVLLTIAMLTTFERPPVQTVQRGFRGTAMEELYNPRDSALLLAKNQAPPSLPYAGNTGPKAGTVYKNVQVLGDVSVGEFTRLMVSITNWVAPAQGCAACHNTANMAEDSVYTKVVARRMLQMVQHINADYKPHVAETGVTCYTCHRGQLVPSQIWFNPAPSRFNGAAETGTGMGRAAPAAGGSSLPYDPFTPFLEKAEPIRVQAEQALPGTDLHSIKETEWTYALMIHFATSLGVNCTYCHNTRAFGSWEESTPQRVTAWYGINMVRDLNDNYLDPLQPVFPAGRLGPTGDAPKVNCATCHQGVFKPLYGVSMVKTFPELQGPTQSAAHAENRP